MKLVVKHDVKTIAEAIKWTHANCSPESTQKRRSHAASFLLNYEVRMMRTFMESQKVWEGYKQWKWDIERNRAASKKEKGLPPPVSPDTIQEVETE